MVYFPVIESLDVEGYGLYPGTPAASGLRIDLSAPLTLVVGANGLGKSTLLSIALRLLTGPVDISRDRSEELGSRRLDPSALSITAVRTFARRAPEAIADATASISFRLGSHRFIVTRRLADLRLVAYSDRDAEPSTLETEYQKAVFTASGLSSFADWLLVLRYVTFYMDERQVLFWDRSAQRQLLRTVFLPPSAALEWVTKERAALESDSRFRNTRTVVNKLARDLAQQVDPSTPAHAEATLELASLLDAEEDEDTGIGLLVQRIADLDERRSKLNFERLTTRQREDSALRDYEFAKLRALEQQFPSDQSSALFIWSQLLDTSRCIACDSEVPALRDEINQRLTSQHCAVCDTPLRARVDSEVSIELGVERAQRAWIELSEYRDRFALLDSEYQAISSEINKLKSQLQESEIARLARRSRIEILEALIPREDQEFVARVSQLELSRIELERLEDSVRTTAGEFSSYIDRQSHQIFTRANEVKEIFDRYSKLFLVEDAELSWEPREERIGQSQFTAKIPTFELRLGRGAEESLSIRNDAGDVSESQKEFIDLAFRMALIEVAGEQSHGTIVIDTPESSLDSVFSKRAAEVLASFVSTPNSNRLLVASNLTDGRLVPELVKRVPSFNKRKSLVNLLKVARPTAATSALQADYDDALSRLVGEIDGD